MNDSQRMDIIHAIDVEQQVVRIPQIARGELKAQGMGNGSGLQVVACQGRGQPQIACGRVFFCCGQCASEPGGCFRRIKAPPQGDVCEPGQHGSPPVVGPGDERGVVASGPQAFAPRPQHPPPRRRACASPSLEGRKRQLDELVICAGQSGQRGLAPRANGQSDVRTGQAGP